MRLLNFSLICLLLSSVAHGQNSGNRESQEAADVVTRLLDFHIPDTLNRVVPVNDVHSAIYIGQTTKTDALPSVPFYHTVIEMAGLQPQGIDKLGYVTKVFAIGVANFGDFSTAHPIYYGAYKPNQVTVPLYKRQRILERAQLLLERGDRIKYIVTSGEHSSRLLRNYFEAGVDELGNNLANYTGNYLQITRMRSDAFVEYCYAYAGVPIMESNIATHDGAWALVFRSGMQDLFPTDQQARMTAAQTENPIITAKNENGVAIPGEVDAVPVTFSLSDVSSGPGLLKIHKEPYQSDYGREDFTPFTLELLQNGRILAENILESSDTVLSPKTGLTAGYYTATAYDHAGNPSQPFNFTVPKGPPGSLFSETPLYKDFVGVSTMVPSSLEHDHSVTFDMQQEALASVNVDGPNGNLISWNFNPPAVSTTAVLGSLPAGFYNIRAVNSVGAETVMPFNVADLGVAVSTEASSATVSYNPSDPFATATANVNVNVQAAGSNALDRIELRNSSGTLLENVAGSGNTSSVNFALPTITFNHPLFAEDAPFDYAYFLASPYDKLGNRRVGSFDLATIYDDGPYYSTTPYSTNSQTYRSEVVDLLGHGYLSGTLLSNYKIVGDTLTVHEFSADATLVRSGVSGGFTDRQYLGDVAVKIRTGDQPDLSDAVEMGVESASLYYQLYISTVAPPIKLRGGAMLNGYSYGYITSAVNYNPRFIGRPKRYYQTEIVFNKATPTSFAFCAENEFDENWNVIGCKDGYDLDIGFTAGIARAGINLAYSGIVDPTGYDTVYVGNDIHRRMAGGSAVVDFSAVTGAGALTASIIKTRPPNGLAESPANTAYRIAAGNTLSFSGATKLTLKYSENLSSAQENNLRIFRVIDPASGKYEDLGGVRNQTEKTISTEVSSFGDFIVAAYEFRDPYPVQSPNLVNGSPEVEFVSGAPATLTSYDMSGALGQAVLSGLKTADRMPVGNVYQLSASTQAFEPSGAIKMRYSAANVSMMGVPEDSLGIYGLTTSGGLYRLPYQTLDKDSQVLTARVPSGEYPLYAVLASSQQVENMPPSVYPDYISPETEIGFGGPAAQAADGTFISSVTAVVFTASDKQIPSAVSSGVNLTNYILNPESSQVEISTYTGPFHLPEGVWPMYYLSVDNAGNSEFPKGTTVYVDATAPETTLGAPMFTLAPGTNDHATIAGDISLSATDPLVLGVRSGVHAIFYLVDTQVQECPDLVAYLANPTQQPAFNGTAGTCGNPLYAAPFTLSTGPHTVQYFSGDSVANMEHPKTFYLEVVAGDTVPPDTYLSVNGSTIPSGGAASISPETNIIISAEDPVSTGIVSGLKSIYFLVDVAPDSCGEMGLPISTAPAGTCENYIYSAPFSLSVGTHAVHYTAVDNAGNTAAIKSAFFTVSSGQAALPIVPSSGPIGVPFTIDGAGFGTYSAGTTVVLLGGTTAPLTLWTDTKIQGTIPGALAAGQYPVVVKRGAEVLAEVSPFTVTQPALYALTPSSGAIGLPFTITGESFGNYVAGYTRVLLGGATMPLTLWIDTKIQGTIPGTLPAGDYELVVERALNGGVVRTSTTTFSLRDMEAYWLAPSSGPIGMPFTITGVGFGNYSSVYTHVLIGDTTAPLTLWTDSKIQGTVPGSLASGLYPVLVERRTSDGGVMRTSPMSFEVVNVDVASMTPVAGPIGMPFTIYGGNFGNYVASYTRVLIGGTICPLTLWTADKIQGAIPGALGPGEYPVIVERELNGGIVQSQALAFTVSTPTAYNMTPSSGPIGIPFTINGESFGNYSAAYTGVLINGATVPLTLWTDSKIQGTIPGNLAPGQYPVMVGRMTADGGMVGSNALTFEVVGVNVASMTPVAGPIGMPFTIYGSNFGNYSAGFTKVLIGGTTCPLTLWTDTKIQGTVPGSLQAGDYQMVVERSLNGGQVQSVPVAFAVTAPEAYSFSPSSGPIGLPFTIMGANFGNYVANYTKVLVGGAAAPLTLWTDTKIQGTIPGSLVDGEHEVVVERVLNGGVAYTSTFTFTVGAPYLDTLSPSTASVIAPFTITGYNFGNYVANYTKVLINGTTTALTLWTDTKIQGKLPFLLAGTYPVQVQRYLNGGLAESATAYINVEEPAVSSMTPVSGAAGTVFNLYGTGFGPYDATIAKVFMGGAQCSLSLWTDTRITGTVPSGLSYGTHTVVAMRGQAVSNGLEFYIPGGYTPSMMRPGTGTLALEFKLGEVYVYPDPAKGGKVPTFHIEVGTADSVKLNVYTVAGQLAHEATLTGSPQAVGSVYAYEYAWTGRIASGVYYYTIEAERSGKKLKAKGRFSVVR